MRALWILSIFLPLASASASAGDLADLEGMTFTCTGAALNAAARSAATVTANGTYHFVSFKEKDGGAYYSADVGFRSNVEGAPDLNYSVTLYCQQGWDPNATVKVTRK